jgi:probable rRNA maturation factor
MAAASDDGPLGASSDTTSDSSSDISGIALDLRAPPWAAALPDIEPVCRRAVAAARKAAAVPAGEISLVLADDAFIRVLNRDHRGKDRATDVLSFPLIEDGAPDPETPVLLGDVVVAYETAARDAETAGVRLADHLAHLIIHGVLHLAGHDHEDDAEAEAMEGLERAALATLGIADPYSVIAPAAE